MKVKLLKRAVCILTLMMIIMIGFPGMKAYAASSPKLDKKTVYLIMGEENRDEYRFKVKNAKKGWGFLWSTDNEDVAQIDETNGTVTAKKIGSTLIYVQITNEDGKKIYKLSAKVIVKDNIKKLDITNKPVKDKLTIGKEHDFNRTYVTGAGKASNTTSITRWIVDKATASISDAGIFKATQAGTYTITALAFQSKEKYGEWLALKDPTSRLNVLCSNTYTFAVVDDTTGVKQLNLNDAEITFTTEVKAMDLQTNLTVSALTSTGVKEKQTIRKITVSDDGKKATITLNSSFQSKKTYVFDYAGMSSCQFTAATAELNDVADIVIKTQGIVVNKASEIEIGILNSNGVDIGTINKDLHKFISISAESSVFVSVNSKVIPNQVTFYNIGDSAVITAVFHTYDYDPITGKEIGAITRKKTIGAIATPSNPASSVIAWSLGKTAPDANFSSVNHVISEEEGAVNLYIKAALQDGVNYINNIWQTGNEGWQYTSSDSSILDVSHSSNQTAVLYPIKAGVVNILVSYTENRYTANPVYSFVGSITIAVTPKRRAATLNLSNDAITISNTSQFTDTKTVAIRVLDQYGVDMQVYGVSITEKENSINGVDPINPAQVSALDTSLTFRGVSSDGTPTTPGTYVYTVSANGLTKVITVYVNAPASNTTNSVNYKFSVAAKYDQKVSFDTQLPINVDIKILGYAPNGVAYTTLNSATAAAENYSVTLTMPNGANTILYASGTDPYVYTTFAITNLSNGYAVKAETGAYTLKLYKGSQLIDTAEFIVIDSQPEPYCVVNKLTAEFGTTVETAVEECISVYQFGGYQVIDMALIRVEPSDYYGTNTSASSVFVKYIRYDEAIGNYMVTHIIAVNRVLELR